MQDAPQDIALGERLGLLTKVVAGDLRALGAQPAQVGLEPAYYRVVDRALDDLATAVTRPDR